MPSISVIVPVYNRAAVLRSALASILSQSFTDIELIVVDDGSDDNVKAVTDSLADERLVLLRHEHNRGVAAARNSGWRHARGDYVAFLDSDDQWRLDKLKVQLHEIKTLPKPALITTSIVRVNPRTGRQWFSAGSSVEFSFTQTWLVHRQALEDCGGFKESLSNWEDLELFLRLREVVEHRHLTAPWVISSISDDGLGRNASARLIGIEAILETLEQHNRPTPEISRYAYLAARYAVMSGAFAKSRQYLSMSLRRSVRNPQAWALLVLTWILGFQRTRALFIKREGAA